MIIACVVLQIAGVAHVRSVIVASGRAIVQLTIVALALRGVFAAPIAVIAVVTVMFGVAVWTAGCRLRGHEHAMRSVLLACGVGAVVTIAIIVGLPTLTR